MKWEDDLRKYVVRLRKKSVIICGDFNVSRGPIDCWDEDNHSKSQVGYTDGERTKMEELLNAGFIDTFRYLHPDSGGRYSWLSYRKDFIRHTNGLRLDYFLVSNDLKDRIGQSLILNDIKGSDHSPIELITRHVASAIQQYRKSRWPPKTEKHRCGRSSDALDSTVSTSTKGR